MERGEQNGANTADAEREFFKGGKTLQESAAAEAAENARLRAANEKVVGEVMGKEFMDHSSKEEADTDQAEAAK